MRAWLAFGCLAAATPAAAQDLRELCADRPGVGTPACTVDPGHLQVELGLADWTRDTQPDTRTDTVLAGDLALRYGVAPATELRLRWTALGHQRERDRMTGVIDRATRTGDVTLGIKQNLANPDGKGLSAALLPQVTLPVGGDPIGQTSWSAALLAPVSYEITEGVSFQLTPELDAAADEERKGRHVAYSAVVGIEFDPSDALALTAELQGKRDRDPDGHMSTAFGALSAAYKPGKRTQFDIGAVAGLNHAAPDLELYLGVTQKF